MYVVRAKGNSMLPKIKDGDMCIFRANVVGSRQNKIVLVQHNDVYDSENEGSYSIKKYTSEKVHDKITGEWKHEKIILKPENIEYENILIQDDDGFLVVGEFIGLV
jgi:SOS-response transcriptional repressor LexA